ncbi:hypothetical protein [Fulvimarina sp. MAC8]|uniref:hypothetical protein n=1 Tax=Fulvimarina sp. MAC8 TaxID=3162874 RepID=UPI0032EC047B
MTRPETSSDVSIAKRLVFVFPGFEPLPPEAQIARFRRAAERSAAVFEAEVAFTAGDATADKNQSLTVGDKAANELNARLTPRDAKESVDTDLIFCTWDDLIEEYAAIYLPKRVSRGFAALGAFLINGTFFRYCRTSWRYALFFLFPILLTLAILAIGVALALTLGSLFDGPTTWLAGILIGTAASAILFYLANRRWFLTTAFDDWALARELCEGTNPKLDRRIDEFAKRLKDRAQSGEPDEIIVAAHSLGASFAVPALARAFANGLAPNVPLHILTVGSSLMKTALHPKAEEQREAVRHLTVDHGIPWTDCQALTDPINFYKSNPAGSLGIAADPMPLVVKLRLRQMVAPATYRRIKRDFFRLHRQFVLAVERRSPYSFHMLLLGPASMQAFREHRTINRAPLAQQREKRLGNTVIAEPEPTLVQETAR